MTIRKSIANMRPGDLLIVDRRSEVNYVRSLAKQNGQKLRQEKQDTGEWVLYCIGLYECATLEWIKRIRYKREWWRRRRAKSR
jgi:hypothetical protein